MRELISLLVLISLLGLVRIAKATPQFECATLNFHHLLETPDGHGARYNQLWQWLHHQSTDGSKIIEFVSQDPVIKGLFTQGAGV